MDDPVQVDNDFAVDQGIIDETNKPGILGSKGVMMPPLSTLSLGLWIITVDSVFITDSKTLGFDVINSILSLLHV